MLGDTQEDAADGSQSVTEVTENIFSSWISKKKNYIGKPWLFFF